MKKIRESDLLKDQELRKEVVKDNLNVLMKVKEIHNIPGLQYVTLKNVASYYDVSYGKIAGIVRQYEKEIGDKILLLLM